MKRWRAGSVVVAALAALAAAGCATAGPAPSLLPTTKGSPFIAGYHPYWAGDSWRSYPLELLDELYFFESEVGADGTFAAAHGWPGEWAEMTEEALADGVQVVPTVSLHDPAAFESLFTDPARIDRLVETSLGLLDADPRLAGVHVDVEVFQSVTPEARDGFTSFVELLAQRMGIRHPGASLSVFALAFDDDDVYDEGALGRAADFLVVQGYDYHSAGSPNAGPVGATRGWGRLNWDTVVARFEAVGVPAGKLVMGVPLYGIEWPVESDAMGAATRGLGRTLPYTADPDVLPTDPRALDRVREHGLRRDPETGVPWYAFRTEDGWVQGWFDDPESLRMKYDFVQSRGLGGIALFPLAYADAEVWEQLRRTFPPR